MAGFCLAGFEGFDCSIVYILMILLFFITAIFRRQVADALLNMPYSLIGGTAAAEIVYIVSIYITHNFRWAFLFGLIGCMAGGFVGAWFLPDGESGGEE